MSESNPIGSANLPLRDAGDVALVNRKIIFRRGESLGQANHLGHIPQTETHPAVFAVVLECLGALIVVFWLVAAFQVFGGGGHG